ncbi:hypothetical protein [Haloglycomyces albus]|uniref:hypothetical protein n=1 Tax=Haloglycomyces albus TaxID=526067 RepID=UPI00046D83EE|nr:hypothetical protein [Haloglycomyces albus]
MSAAKSEKSSASRPSWLPERWLPMLVLFLGLIVSHYLVRWLLGAEEEPAWLAGLNLGVAQLVVFSALVLVPVLGGAHWAFRYPQNQIVPNVLPVLLVATLWNVLFNLTFVPNGAFPDLNHFFSSFVVVFAAYVVGTYLGYLIMVATGFDFYGRQLKVTEHSFAKKANLVKK